MAIEPFGLTSLVGGEFSKIEKPAAFPQIRSEDNFSSYLEKSISSVNQMLEKSDDMAAQMASGKSENLHEATIAFEKAETAFKLMVQVRNKAIEAYQEIMRMQV